MANGGEGRSPVRELDLHRAGERAERGQRLGGAENVEQTLADDAAAQRRGQDRGPVSAGHRHMLEPGDDHALRIGDQQLSPGRAQPRGAETVELALEFAVEFGAAAACAIDALGHDVGAGFEVLEQFADHLPAMVEDLNEGPNTDSQKERDDERRHSPSQGGLSGQQTAISRLGDRLSQSLD